MDEARKQRERAFHNSRFLDDPRAPAHRFYDIARSSFAYYEQFLFERCHGKRVIEYGCGHDTCAFALARRGARVTGIDLSEVAIEQMRIRAWT